MATGLAWWLGGAWMAWSYEKTGQSLSKSIGTPIIIRLAFDLSTSPHLCLQRGMCGHATSHPARPAWTEPFGAFNQQSKLYEQLRQLPVLVTLAVAPSAERLLIGFDRLSGSLAQWLIVVATKVVPLSWGNTKTIFKQLIRLPTVCLPWAISSKLMTECNLQM